MEYKDLRIVFLGTPDFAKGCLKTLVEAGLNIVGVVTAPDKPAGRGLKLQETAVKQYAVEMNILVLQPEKLKNPEFLNQLKALEADAQIVVAFRMLPTLVWDMPPMGTINLHASLLPDYRGAAPINWAIIKGEKTTGITTFKLQQEIDTGDILLQEQIEIGETETAGSLHDKMMEKGGFLLLETIKGIADGSLKAFPQSFVPNTIPKSAPKIFTATCQIDWNNSVEEVYNLIRGLSPYPGAFTHLNDKLFKIYEAVKEISVESTAPGTVLVEKNALKFACLDGYICPTLVQPEGKRKMEIGDFVRGMRM
jgi:methionyl-tRNA formyltransferase